MRLVLKDSTIDLSGLSIHAVVAILTAMRVWQLMGMTSLVITSALDGEHKNGSKHYTGDAIDIRSKTLPDQLKARDMLQAELGDDYDVILELTHIHVEYDPRP